MGGHKAGDYASRCTVETIVEAVAESSKDSYEDIIKEAIEKEGFDGVHDDEQKNNELVLAAMCYAEPNRCGDGVPPAFPWDACWWKPSPNDRIKELTKAGALIAAEIDRLIRSDANNWKLCQ